MYREACIGIDQSYKRTGISVSADGQLKLVRSVDFSKLKTKTEKRALLMSELECCIPKIATQSKKTVIILERLRIFSNDFISLPYIKSMGALDAVVVDAAFHYGIEVFNVDTRAWKACVIGTSKPCSNSFGVDPKKWPTVEWCIKHGFRRQLMVPASKQKKKGVFKYHDRKYVYDDDAADSAAISMFWFKGEKSKLLPET